VSGSRAHLPEYQGFRVVHHHDLFSKAYPLHEGMHFAAARQTEVASQFFVLREGVSLAAQSIIGLLVVDVPQACVVGEIVPQF
jgi:hypothetical protein